MTKLILINGPSGSGKSTLSAKYAEDHPFTLRIDTDEIRRLISHHRTRADESSKISKKMVLEMARVHLEAGHDVVVSQQCMNAEYLENFEALAQERGADYYEFLLVAEQEEVLRRFIERGKANGFSDGFDPEGLIAKAGKEKRVEEMYDQVMSIATARSKCIRILSGENPGETYQRLLEKITEHARQ